MTTSELAKELGVSRASVNSWVRDGVLKPTFTTPGGHHRWDLEDVRRQLLDRRQHNHEE